MLNTVLEIGKAYRQSPDGLKHHRYIKSCPDDTDKRKILRLSIPVEKDFGFALDGIHEITDENLLRSLYYLTFKTSDADSLVKYVFGDIYYSLNKGKEGGYFRLGDPSNKQKTFRMNSFKRGEEDFQSIVKSDNPDSPNLASVKFNKKLAEHYIQIERLLRYQVGIDDLIEKSRKDSSKLKMTDLLESEDKLKLVTAERMFYDIKNSRSAAQIWRELKFGDEPKWDLIRNNEDAIIKLVNQSSGEIFLHFDFDGRHWYEYSDDFKLLSKKMLDDFTEEVSEPEGIMLKKYLYKTLSSAEKDVQFPGFQSESRYRNKIFKDLSEIENLFYAIDYTQNALIKIQYTDIKIVVLPKGDNLDALDYEKFVRYEEKSTIKEKEEEINQSNLEYEDEPLFSRLTEKVADKIIKYDLILSKQGGTTSPDVDIVELSGLEKSHLRLLHIRMIKIKNKVMEQRTQIIKADLIPLSITRSFLSLLNDNTSGLKKYQSHLYKVLPQIYTGTYYRDPLLLKALIERTEFNIRSEKENFNLLKFDFYFLTILQNTKEEGASLMSITQSQSYRIGTFLGQLARPLKMEIKSFEKSYVGNLTRRISTLPDLIRFKTFVEEKLVIHDKTKYQNVRDSSIQLSKSIKDFSGRFDKNECAFGFFESYFAHFKTNEQEDSE